MKLHKVEKARKAIPEAGIEKGDSYYWWKPYRGGRRVSKKKPKPSQLMSSEFLSNVFCAQEDLEAACTETATRKDLIQALEDAKSVLEEQGDEQQDKFSNLPENFQNGEQGERMTARQEACEQLVSEIEDILGELTEDEDAELTDEERESFVNRIADLDFGSFE